VESLVKSNKYVLPLAVLHPVVAGTLVAAYLGDGRFHPDPKALVFDPERQETPVERDAAPGSLAATENTRVSFSPALRSAGMQ
jgi:hypothetical protein